MTAKQMDLAAQLAAIEQAGAAAREQTRLLREAIQDAHQVRRELDERIHTAKAEIEDYSMSQIAPLLDKIVEAKVGELTGQFGKFSDALYKKLNREARRLVEDVITIIDGTGDVSPAEAMRARATIARFKAQEAR